MFLPYRIDSRVGGIPLLTLLVCVLCCAVYYKQYLRDSAHFAAVERFCERSLQSQTQDVVAAVSGMGGVYGCYDLFSHLADVDDPGQEIDFLSETAPGLGIYSSRTEEVEYVRGRLSEAWRTYQLAVPESMTETLMYSPGSLNVWKMITSSMSHGDVMHLLGNLLFFYIFAASVELIIGHLSFLAFLLLSMVVTNLSYSYAMLGVPDALPTVGLSGVVMAAVAALAVMLPMARIRCFLWIIIIFRVIRVPAILLAVWFVGWDIYEMNTLGQSSPINYVAHISGALTGAAIGAGYVLFRRERIDRVAAHY